MSSTDSTATKHGPRATVSAGDRFTRLVVFRELEQRARDGSRVYLCLCDCGATVEVPSNRLRTGNTRSCGCLKREQAAKNGRDSSLSHGMEGTRTYRSWRAMMDRCTNPNATGYERYGAVGVVPCARMRTFEGFLATLGVRPDDTSVDRIDCEGGYWCGECEECLGAAYPRNVRWADRLTQRHNRRRV